MRLNEKTINYINENLSNKKKSNPINSMVVGIGVNLRDSIGRTGVYKDNWQVCNLDELGRMIEELTMLKEAIEEETGLML